MIHSNSSLRSRTDALTASIRLLILLLASIGLAGCGDSGVGSGSASATGSLSIFLTDSPSEDFDQILVTIEGIDLIGGGPQVTVFSGSEVVDLKQLENFSDLFVHADQVPARSYSIIRMRVSQVELVRNSGESNEERIDADVPANGKIDLNPKGPFSVRPGVDLVVEIDMDAKKSIHVHGTGSGKYKFRPVVFVSIRNSVAPVKLTRVHGEVTEVVDDLNFELCSTKFMATPEPLESRDKKEGGIGDRYRCMMVELDENTGVFDTNGDPLDGPLEMGDLATVIGRFHIVDANHDDDSEMEPDEAGAPSAALAGVTFEHRPHIAMGGGHDWNPWNGEKKDKKKKDKPKHDDDSDRPDVELVFLAYVIELGPPDTFLTLGGVVESEVDDMDEFDFALDPGQGFGDDSIVSALLQMGTRIFTRSGYEVADSEIIPDTVAAIDGIFSISSTDPTVLKTALVVLDIVPDFDAEVRGTIVEIDSDAQRLFLDTDDDACVDVDEGTRILILEEGEGGATTTNGEFSDLMVGWRVDAYGTSEGLECLAADTIVAFPEDVVPVVCTSNEGCLVGEFCDKADGACEAEGVCAPMPEACTLDVMEVCGCDGTTYTNTCEANAAGTSVAKEGACEPSEVVCGGIGGLPCGEGEICHLMADECITDPLGVCVPEPETCPDVLMLVCGCDGVTYQNECEAIKAGALITGEGACVEPD